MKTFVVPSLELMVQKLPKAALNLCLIKH